MKNLNLVFAVVVSILFVVAWEFFVASRYRPKPAPVPIQDKTAQNDVQDLKKHPVLSPQEMEKKPSVARTLTLRTATAKVSLQTQGAAVTSWRVREKEHWVELVNTAPGSQAHPLTTAADLNFDVVSEAPQEATLSAVHPAGYKITKTLTLSPDDAFHTLRLSFSNPSNTPIPVEMPVGWAHGLEKTLVDNGTVLKKDPNVTAEMRALGFTERIKAWQPGFFTNRHIDLLDQAPYRWVGVDNAHFLAALVSPQAYIEAVHVVASRNNAPSVFIPLRFDLNPAETKEVTYRLYVGPKKLGLLERLNYSLEKSVDFGFFGIIAKGLLKMLEYLHRLTDNYGWAIILLTVIVQIAVFPLTKRSFEHALRMKELQPQIKKLQEQFKNDPKRLQIETMNLYKKNGMKLLGMEGCLPILLQIPIFFAFYSTLRVAYELRGAPWIFWIKDLGVHDPYYVLPILMGLGMFLQQKLTTVTADPAQAKMMLFMPVIFTVMFLKLPAGLVLYWVVNSAMTVIAQKIMTWRRHHHTS